MKRSWKRILSLVLAFALLLALTIPGFAANEDEQEEQKGGYSVTWEKIDAQPRLNRKPLPPEGAEARTPDEMVRVSIVLGEPAVLQAGFSGEDYASDYRAHQYREGIHRSQDRIVDIISADVLNGEKLDVVWNLTLAANIISANVPFGKIEAIKALDGVRDVILEACYEPMADDPDMSNAAEMTGSVQVWANGYTGAGSVVAIVDTGLDTDHELFQPEALLYAIEETDKDVELMTEANVTAVWDQLNASSFLDSAEGVYLNAKVPFGVNYVDRGLDITHDNDSQGEHGSHVAGIAAANRFVGEDRASALDSVLTQGQAPDAQILVMKVFGKGGGAYDSDYMAAIEDAIVLGADAVNLSLGSAAAGFVTSESYQSIMEDLVNSDTVVVMSAGNSYFWPDQTSYGYLYSDGVNFDTVGSPGSYANSLTVASVDNNGVTGAYLTAYDEQIFYTETSGYGNEPMTTIAGEQEFVFVDSTGVDDNDNVGKEGDDFLALGSDVLSGKIAVCWRGSSSFFAKANAAAAQGAVGVIVANNQDGSISMNLTGYEYTIPVVSITQAEGQFLLSQAEAVEDEEGGALCYTGTLEVGAGIGSSSYDSDTYTMSDFSSWGVPGDLSLKPEITAPGGSIYSVNGLTPGGQAYETMSGTSMAAPQIAGIAALMAQYIRENDLAAQTGLSCRALINSLLMSTAMPLIEEESGCYYPVMRQGAGLVDADAAVSADTYVLMNGDATVSCEDGKVKAELGDDPERTGEYGFSFTLNNLTEKDLEYTLAADFFTQDIYYFLMDTCTVLLEPDDVSWTADGAECDPEEGVVVPASGSVEIGVTFSLSELASYDDRGTYVEGYVYAIEKETEDGAAGTVHSIPVLGYYGSWIEPSMHDVGSRLEYLYGMEDRYPYLYPILEDESFEYETYGVKYGWNGQVFSLGGNPYMDDEEYMPERNAIAADSTVSGVYYSLIRNAAGSLFLVADAEDNILAVIPGGAQNSAYYNYNDSSWNKTKTVSALNYQPEDMEDGDEISLYFYLYPEYYPLFDEEGYPDYGVLGTIQSYGDPIALDLVVDSTAPEVISASADDEGLTVEVGENRYVAAVVIWDEENWNDLENGEPMLEFGGDPEEEEGAGRVLTVANGTEEGQLDLSAEENRHLMIQVFDYAANYVTYKLNLNEEELEGGPQGLTITPETASTIPGGRIYLTAAADPWGTDESVTWSSDDESVAAVDENGVVTGVAEGTAVITAVSSVNPEAIGTATVEVVCPDIDLNAAIFDPEGKVAFARINTKDLIQGITDYEVLKDADRGIIDMSWDLSGEVLYAADLSDDFTSTLYTLDPATLELTEIGSDSQIAFLGMAPSTAMPAVSGNENETMLTIYGPYLLGIDVSTGTADTGSLVSVEEDIDGTNLIGIAHIEPFEYYDGALTGDAYFLVDDQSSVYYAMVYQYAGTPYTDVQKVGSFDAPVNADHYNSLYYDGENLFWSRFCYDTEVASLYMWADLWSEDDGSIYFLGDFAESVWPVGGLVRFEFTFLPEFEWAEDCSEAVAVFYAQENSSKEPFVLPADVVLTEQTDPTCEEPGELVYTATVVYDGTTYEDTQSVEVPALGHDYELRRWKWAGNCCGATAIFVCKNDSEHVVELEAELETIEEREPTEDEDGIVTVRATVTFEDVEYTDVDSVILPALGADNADTEGSGPKPISDTPREEEPFPFKDVKKLDWFYSDVEAMWRAGFIKGTSETTYSPEDSISRAQIVTILFRMDGERRTDVPAAFEDVPAGAYYADAVAWAAANGIVFGMSETEFAPTLDITREQFAAIIYRYARYRGLVDQPQGSLAGFRDAGSVSSWATEAMIWNCQAKLILGVGDDTLDPKGTATRAQAAAVFNRLFKLL